MVSPVSPSGDIARDLAESAGRSLRAIEQVLAEALSRHPHDQVRVLQALGAALLLAQDARHQNDELREIIYAARRRGG